MRHGSFLKDYAKWYDKFYEKKDYRFEAEILDKIFKQHNVKSVLDIACGTGNHLIELKKLGYEVTGQDISKDMLEIARKKDPDISFKQLSMTNFPTMTQYDAIICMFASFDYLIDLNSVKSMLSCVHLTLKENGVFVFDFWNKPCVEKAFVPIVKKPKRMSLTRIDKENDLAIIKICFDDYKKQELHKMKYYEPVFIKDLLKYLGFKVEKIFPFCEPERDYSEADWSLQVICKKN